MAVFFQLIPKGDREPEGLLSIDEKICGLMNMPVDEVKYCLEWFDCLGFRYAMGDSTDKVVAEFEDLLKQYPDDVHVGQMLTVAKYLRDNYETNHWFGRR